MELKFVENYQIDISMFKMRGLPVWLIQELFEKREIIYPCDEEGNYQEYGKFKSRVELSWKG